MASKRKASDDFENRFFDLLEGTIEGIDKKTDKISDEQQRQRGMLSTVNERLGRLERKVFPKPNSTSRQDLPVWYRDPQLIKLFTYIVASFILLLIIIASLRGIKLPGIFG